MFEYFKSNFLQEFGNVLDIKTLEAISTASKADYANFQDVWKARLEKHYPEEYQTIIEENPDSVNWQLKFKTLYEEEFGERSGSWERFCLGARDGDLSALHDVTFIDLSIYPHALISYAENQQHVLNYFYTILVNEISHYEHENLDILLYYAIYCRQSLDVIAKLIENGAGIDERICGLNAFGNAIKSGNFTAVQYFITRYQIDVQQPDFPGGCSWLRLATAFGQHHIVRYFLQLGLDVNELLPEAAYADYLHYVYFYGQTALDQAIEARDIVLVKILIEAGAHVTATQLFDAAWLKDLKTMEYLFDNYPQYINVANIGRGNGRTPLVVYFSTVEFDLNFSTISHDYYPGYKLFREHGVDLFARIDIRENQFLLYYATLIGDMRIIEDLVASGVSVHTAIGKSNESVLQVAAQANRMDILQFYIDHCRATIADWDINLYVNNSGETVLYNLLTRDFNQAKMKIAHRLLENGANPDRYPSPESHRLLCMAVGTRNHELFDLLLAYGATWDINSSEDVYNIALESFNAYIIRKHFTGRICEPDVEGKLIDYNLNYNRSENSWINICDSVRFLKRCVNNQPQTASGFFTQSNKTHRELEAITALLRVMVQLDDAEGLRFYKDTLKTINHGELYRSMRLSSEPELRAILYVLHDAEQHTTCNLC